MATPPLHYPLATMATREAPRDIAALDRWLKERSGTRAWFAKLYVAQSVRWDGDAGAFLQEGCSPNYHAGWWTLACCKFDMRSARSFKDLVVSRETAVFIMTCARKPKGVVGQPLVSVARVTHWFDSMSSYAAFIAGADARGRALRASRLTGQRVRDGGLGWRFGDCHADADGRLRAPAVDHVHGQPRQWRRDLADGHMILASNEFVVWRTPQLATTKVWNQLRFGIDVSSSNLSSTITRL